MTADHDADDASLTANETNRPRARRTRAETPKPEMKKGAGDEPAPQTTMMTREGGGDRKGQ
jgi:hypothetical protein